MITAGYLSPAVAAWLARSELDGIEELAKSHTQFHREYYASGGRRDVFSIGWDVTGFHGVAAPA